MTRSQQPGSRAEEYPVDDDGWTEVGGGWVNLITCEVVVRRYFPDDPTPPATEGE